MLKERKWKETGKLVTKYTWKVKTERGDNLTRGELDTKNR